MASNKGLGKGLGALLGDFTEEPAEKSAYQMLPIYKVEQNPRECVITVPVEKKLGVGVPE